jgi:uncharacterized protein (TIGR03435 family)
MRAGAIIRRLAEARRQGGSPAPQGISMHAVAFLCVTGLVWAQSFEVATVKPTDPKNPAIYSLNYPTPSTFAGTGTVARFIMVAYGVEDYQVIGAPKWASEDRFDIQGKADSAAGPAKMRPMLQALLAERFGLAVHREERPFPVYAMVVEKGGLKAKSVAEDTTGISMGKTFIRGTMTLEGFAKRLAGMVGRPVKDETGLAGLFSVKLELPVDNEGMAPSIFTAVREQVGVRLEPVKRPVEVLVVDRVARPSEN